MPIKKGYGCFSNYFQIFYMVFEEIKNEKNTKKGSTICAPFLLKNRDLKLNHFDFSTETFTIVFFKIYFPHTHA